MQTERTQVGQKTLRKKTTGQKHIETTREKNVVCLYFSRDMHPILPTFIKLIFKTVNRSCDNNIKKKAVPVIYNTVIENMLTYCCFEGQLFANNCSNDGLYPFNTLITMIISPRIREYFILGISIFASLSSQVKFDNRSNIQEAGRRTFSIKSSSYFSSGYQIVTQYSR